MMDRLLIHFPLYLPGRRRHLATVLPAVEALILTPVSPDHPDDGHLVDCRDTAFTLIELDNMEGDSDA